MNKVEPQWGVKMKQMLRRQPLPSWRPHQVECASLTLISFPDGLISTGDRAFEGAAPLFSPICLGFLIIRILDRTASCKLLEQQNVRIAQASSWRRAAKLGFMGRVQTVCCRIVSLHQVQSCYSVVTGLIK
eukprot:scaffold45633_cov85-Phaeocystis_antarctica.AAC.2